MPVEDNDDVPWYIDQGYDTGQGSEVTEDNDPEPDRTSGGSSPDDNSSPQDEQLEEQLERVAQEGGRAGRQAGEVLQDIRQGTNPQLALQGKERLQQREDVDDRINNVVVTGDPSEGEEVRTVGSGDTIREARRDAAENPRFDASEGEEVNQIEERRGTDQPLLNLENENPREIQRRLQSVANQRSGPESREARELAQAIQEGRERFDSVDLQRKSGALQVVGRRQPEPENDTGQRQAGFFQRNTDFNVYSRGDAPEDDFKRNDRLTEIETVVDPRKGNPDADVFEELTTAGVDLMTESSRVAEDVVGAVPTVEEQKERGQEFVEDTGILEPEQQERFERLSDQFVPDQATTSGPSPNIALVGETAELGIEGLQGEEPEQEDIVNIAKIQSPLATEEESQAQRDVATGIVSAPGQAPGLAIATLGAVPRAFEENTPSIQEGAAAGVDVTAEEFSDDPTEFIAEETGEEIGEGIASTVILGPIGLGTSLAPTPEFEPEPEPDATFITSSSQTIGTNTNTPGRSRVPSEERIPDLGEQAVGRDITGVRQEPESQLLGQNQGQPEVAQPDTGRRGGVPEDRKGLSKEEVEVLRQRREAEPGVENVEADVRSFGETSTGQPTAEEVVFETNVQELQLQEVFGGDTGFGTSKGQTSGIPLLQQQESDSPQPDLQRNLEGRVEQEGETEINIIEERQQADVFEPDTETGLENEQSGDFVTVTSAEDEEAFRREELAIFGSPLEEPGQLTRGTVSDRLSEEARLDEPEADDQRKEQQQNPESQRQNSLTTQTEDLTGLGQGNDQPQPGLETGQPESPPGLEQVNDPDAVLTRGTPFEPEEETEVEQSVPSPGLQLQNQGIGLQTETEPQPEVNRPLGRNVLGLSRGQTPEFRENFIHSEEQEVVPGLDQPQEFEQDIEQRQRGRPDFVPGFGPGFDPDPQLQEEPTIFEEPTPQFERGRDFDFGSETEPLFFQEDPGADTGLGGTPEGVTSLTAEVFGGSEPVGGPDDPATGLERRGEDEDFLFGDTGLF